jgi:DNA-binding transcriptional ArsR family regulator
MISFRSLVVVSVTGLLVAALAAAAGTAVGAPAFNETSADGPGNATGSGLAPTGATPTEERDDGASAGPAPSRGSEPGDGAGDAAAPSTEVVAPSAADAEAGADGPAADGPTTERSSPYGLPVDVDGLLGVPTTFVPGADAPAVGDLRPAHDGPDAAGTAAADEGADDGTHDRARPVAVRAGLDPEPGSDGEYPSGQHLPVFEASSDGAGTDAGPAAPGPRSGRPAAAAGFAVLLAGLLGVPTTPEVAVATGRRGVGWLRRVGRRSSSSRLGVRLPLVPVAGYSRYDDSDPLDNETRAAIHELVTERPGIYHASLADETGVAVETIRYHGRILADEGLVEEQMIRGRRRLFPVQLNVEDPRVAAALADPDASDIIAAIERREPTTPSALADALDRARSTVSHHLERLEEDGLVARERDGSRCWVRLRSRVRSSSDAVVTSD